MDRMSNATHELGWWIASDGKWYPPELHPDAQQSDAAGRVELHLVETEDGSDYAPAAGWWIASDGKWYPPELHPDAKFSDDVSWGGDDDEGYEDLGAFEEMYSAGEVPPAAAPLADVIPIASAEAPAVVSVAAASHQEPEPPALHVVTEAEGAALREAEVADAVFFAAAAPAAEVVAGVATVGVVEPVERTEVAIAVAERVAPPRPTIDYFGNPPIEEYRADYVSRPDYVREPEAAGAGVLFSDQLALTNDLPGGPFGIQPVFAPPSQSPALRVGFRRFLPAPSGPLTWSSDTPEPDNQRRRRR
jgi:hypothetical protein